MFVKLAKILNILYIIIIIIIFAIKIQLKSSRFISLTWTSAIVF